VVAGSGTCQNTVLMELFKYLIHKVGIASYNILILSFSKITINEIMKRFSYLTNIKYTISKIKKIINQDI
jgi:superfamily I DNA/RNA helicase